MLKGLVKIYQRFLSPFLGNRCRFHPSCSQYALDAIEQHGSIKGARLAIYRILRCNPLSKGWFDPVPQNPSSQDKKIR